MKRASYRAGVQWIADNDGGGTGSHDPEVIAYYISSLLLADLFGVEPLRVGRDVARKLDSAIDGPPSISP